MLTCTIKKIKLTPFYSPKKSKLKTMQNSIEIRNSGKLIELTVNHNDDEWKLDISNELTSDNWEKILSDMKNGKDKDDNIAIGLENCWYMGINQGKLLVYIKDPNPKKLPFFKKYEFYEMIPLFEVIIDKIKELKKVKLNIINNGIKNGTENDTENSTHLLVHFNNDFFSFDIKNNLNTSKWENLLKAMEEGKKFDDQLAFGIDGCWFIGIGRGKLVVYIKQEFSMIKEYDYCDAIPVFKNIIQEIEKYSK